MRYGGEGDALRERTIADYGEQWGAFPDNEGYYGSKELLADILLPLFDPDEVRDARVADIGSGTGRIVRMLLDCGAAHVVALEPSAAFEVLGRNLAEQASRVTLLRAHGEQLPPDGGLDAVFSIGVLHHIPDPLPVVRAAFRGLRPGGRMAIWLYGQEGNRLYLALAGLLRAATTRMPHAALVSLTWALYPPLRLYLAACRFLPLPLRGYMRKFLARLSPVQQRMTIYDQLNPAYARYYTGAEARALLEDGGFCDVRLHHRHGYSWTVVGTKPPAAPR